ncbi:MAG: hypothetical protein F6K50_23050 [Moorea sp. SIO3I7]|uniref:hypothetical protein n=1 Tax=unclassified Moorena TaxID=2683338 RepID=UPI0013C0CB5D|nr:MULTISPECIES: hypothetical protein [unclassified Moorena]NEN98288.1 hypothetical protein [Moorena sp. SIO3I7]NEO10293.1 hypothetical protein [Moorena sp. SIO3I8]NEO22538.1 hypothetical protein [Moorena sp. SIO4A5]NEQ60101.1 hypothetical protein [Moorena sp. SIO4A1]
MGRWGDGECGDLTGVGFLHLGRESGIGSRESGVGNRNPPLTPPRRGRAGNGENYPGKYCVF